KKSGDTVSSELKAEVSRLIEHFALHAFRRPVEKADIQPYLSFALDSLQRGETIANALKGGYRALLCSPRFLYFQEQPGPLDDYAIASRLSYFLWSRMPDQQLLKLAAS